MLCARRLPCVFIRAGAKGGRGKEALLLRTIVVVEHHHHQQLSPPSGIFPYSGVLKLSTGITIFSYVVLIIGLVACFSSTLNLLWYTARGFKF